MITTITNDRFYELYTDEDVTVSGINYVKNLYAKKKIILANGSMWVQADTSGQADTKVFMWSAAENPDYPAKTSIPELPCTKGDGTDGTWIEL